MCFVLCFLMLSRLFITVVWLTAGKGLTSRLLLVMFIVLLLLYYVVSGQVGYLIVSFPDLCRLSYLHCHVEQTYALLHLEVYTSNFNSIDRVAT